MSRESNLHDIIKRKGHIEDLPNTINCGALLMAISRAESSGGIFGGVLRVEPSYAIKGKRYFNEALYRLYGDAAAGSWSSWQIMYPTALELGFTGAPWDLWDDEIAIQWVCRYIEKRVIKRAINRGEVITVEMIADGYNSGTPFDRNIPEDYIFKVKKYYLEEISREGVW